MSQIKRWNKLDNAAKIFPAASYMADSQVFRFTCDMKEPVDPDTLQNALDEIFPRFEIYSYVLKRGLFWYYLEESELQPVVTEEHKKPCAPIYKKAQPGLLFEVTYYGQRINLEVFHVLSDGTGALNFLQALVTRYVALRYSLENVTPDIDASRTQMSADSFHMNYDPKRRKRQALRKKSCRLYGWRYPENRLKLITGHMPAREVIDAAHAHDATVTEYLCAAMIEAVRQQLPAFEMKRPIGACIPVNLRKYFPSESMRNFFNTVVVTYDTPGEGTFDDIVHKIKTDFGTLITTETMTNSMNAFAAIENNIFARLTPLFLKDFFLRRAYLITGKRQTFTLSNIGVAKLPDEIRKYVHAIDVYSSDNHLSTCVCSVSGTLSIGIVSPFLNSDVQKNFFRLLTGEGVHVEISSNVLEGREKQ